MIRLIEALNYRCLRYVRQPLGPFHVLVGPNASGKTSFLDVVSFLGSLVSEGLDAAVRERTENFRDLVWNRQGSSFELALEVAIPNEIRAKLMTDRYSLARYEISVGQENETGEMSIFSERLVLKPEAGVEKAQRELFPSPPLPPKSILMPKRIGGAKTVVNKISNGNDNFYPEISKATRWSHAFRLGPRKSALANLPEDETRFPVATWLKGFLSENVQNFVLNSLLIKKASPPGQKRGFRPDGSNLPWIVSALEKDHAERLDEWITHVQTAFPDLEGIRTVERKDDRHMYLMLRYSGGLEVPSWMASDGTLRLLALTLPAYVEGFSGVYLIEKPENGIHPRAVEVVVQSLSSVYDAQILLASHSPVILGIVEPAQVLCFAKNSEGATDVILGSEHPMLQEWRGDQNLGVLFAAGVLG